MQYANYCIKLMYIIDYLFKALSAVSIACFYFWFLLILSHVIPRYNHDKSVEFDTNLSNWLKKYDNISQINCK